MTLALIESEIRSNVPGVLQYCADGIISPEKTTYARWYQQYVLPPYYPTNRVVNIQLCNELRDAFNRDHETFSTHTELAHAVISETVKHARAWRIAESQAEVNLAAVACALERYRLTHERYPERLEQLVPETIKALPSDPVNGEPLKYRLTNSNRFVLYSVGPDLIDDGGARRPRRADSTKTHVDALFARYGSDAAVSSSTNSAELRIPLDVVWSYPEN